MGMLSADEAQQLSIVTTTCAAVGALLCAAAFVALSCTCTRRHRPRWRAFRQDDDAVIKQQALFSSPASRLENRELSVFADHQQETQEDEAAGATTQNKKKKKKKEKRRAWDEGVKTQREAGGAPLSQPPAQGQSRNGAAFPSEPSASLQCPDESMGGDVPSATTPLLLSPATIASGHEKMEHGERGTLHLRLRRAPPVLKWKIASDLFVMLNTAWISAHLLIVGPSDVGGYRSLPCRAYAVINEVATHASSMWFLFLGVDLWLAARNPFCSSSGNMWWYHLVVWGTTALIMVAINLYDAVEEGICSYCWFDNLEREHPSQLLLFVRQFPLSHCVALLFSVFILLCISGAVGSMDTNASLGLCARRSLLLRGFLYATIFGGLALYKLGMGITLLVHPPSTASVHVLLRYAHTDAAYLALHGIGNVAAALLTVRWARRLRQRAIKLLNDADKLPLVAERYSSDDNDDVGNDDGDDVGNDDDDDDDDDENSMRGAHMGQGHGVGRHPGSFGVQGTGHVYGGGGGGHLANTGQQPLIAGTGAWRRHNTRAHAIKTDLRVSDLQALDRATAGMPTGSARARMFLSHGSGRVSPHYHLFSPPGSEGALGASSPGVHGAYTEGRMPSRLHRHADPYRSGRLRADTMATTTSALSFDSDTALVGRQSHRQAQQRTHASCRADCGAADRRSHGGRDGGGLIDEEEDTDAAALRAMRDDVMLCTLFGIISTLNSTHAPARAISRQMVMLPPVFNREIEFIDYHQAAFARLRSLYGISARDYAASIWGDEMRQEIRKMTEDFSSGRSGSFLYLTHDKQYLIKTVSNKECTLLQELLPEYVTHMEHHPTSLLTRFCGLHAVRLTREQRFITFVVQRHIVNSARYRARVHRMYDLKGSRYSRGGEARATGWPVHSSCCMRPATRAAAHNSGDSGGDRSTGSGAHGNKRGDDGGKAGSSSRPSKGTRHYKDLDLEAHDVISIGEKAKSSLATRLAADVAFLHTQGIIDFSLLVAVHFRRPTTVMPPPLEHRAHTILDGVRATFVQRECIVYVGIVDVLQRYDRRKRLEHFAKTKVFGVDPQELSCVGPDIYCERFCSRVLQHFE